MHTVLVTGGAGYIGSHTAWLLTQQGYRVIVLDSLVHEQRFTHPWATFIHADLADTAVLKNVFAHYNIDAVMHFAASIEVGESVKNPLKFYDNNVTNTMHLLATMVEYGVTKFIFSSSCAVYGIPHQVPIHENHPKDPISPYGKTKLIIEQALEDLAIAHGLSFVVLRYFNAAGALPEHGLGECHRPETHLIPLLLRAAYLQKPFSIFGTDHPTKDGTCVRDFLHVLDIAQAHVLALKHLEDSRPSEAFNLGTGHGYSVKQMVETVERITGMPITITYAAKRAGDPAQLIADPTKAQTLLLWQPRYSDLEFIIRSAWTFETGVHSAQHETQEQR